MKPRQPCGTSTFQREDCAHLLSWPSSHFALLPACCTVRISQDTLNTTVCTAELALSVYALVYVMALHSVKTASSGLCVGVQLETRVETLVETRDAQDEEVARLAARMAVLDSELAQAPQQLAVPAQPPAMPGPGDCSPGIGCNKLGRLVNRIILSSWSAATAGTHVVTVLVKSALSRLVRSDLDRQHLNMRSTLPWSFHDGHFP